MLKVKNPRVEQTMIAPNSYGSCIIFEDEKNGTTWMYVAVYGVDEKERAEKVAAGMEGKEIPLNEVIPVQDFTG